MINVNLQVYIVPFNVLKLASDKDAHILKWISTYNKAGNQFMIFL
jgi:hypothetical protein